MLKVLRETDPQYVRQMRCVGDGQANYSHMRRCHGVNVQLVTDPVGQILWISAALPGR